MGATLITEVPFEDSGSTVASVVVDLDSQALVCPTIVEGSKGVWYVGESLIDNSCVTISTEGSQLDTVIAVYSGTCLHLECVAENDDASPLVRSSRVSWTVTSGVLYYVFVGGAQRQQGEDYTVTGTVSNEVFHTFLLLLDFFLPCSYHFSL